jgi:hypothetical protein
MNAGRRGRALTSMLEERHGAADLEWVDPDHHPFESFFWCPDVMADSNVLKKISEVLFVCDLLTKIIKFRKIPQVWIYRRSPFVIICE